MRSGKGKLEGENRFAAVQDGPFRLELRMMAPEIRYGNGAPIVTVAASKNPFSFFLHDVDRRYPIYIPSYGVVVTTADDTRSYEEIEHAIRARGLLTNLQHIQNEPEESYEAAARGTRSLKVETWLGVSRDMRLFKIDKRLEDIQPTFTGQTPVTLPETNNEPYRFSMQIGRGWGVVDVLSRRLEDGVLPILHGTIVDDDITYQLTAFAALEKNVLSARTLRGTHFLVADAYSAGSRLTSKQQAEMKSLLPTEMNRDEEIVLYIRIEATNKAAVPRYAFFRTPVPTGTSTLDAAKGLRVYKSGRVAAILKLNGKPLRQEEVAILLAPAETVRFDVFIPHRPISRKRAMRLAATDFRQRHQKCRAFWKAKLDAGARISLPDPPLNAMIQAGMLQMDLIMYGREPDGPLMPAIGIYSAVGVYSDKTIEFMDSMGRHDIAPGLDVFP